ncbi:MAG: hypothetical protein ACLSTV_07175 [Coriobacteriales bacterium]
MNEQDHRPSEAERRHNATKKVLKIVGIICIVTGCIFAAIGFIDFFGAMGNGMPTKFWCLFIGLPLTAIGIMITMFAFKREISRYVKNESVPVINETGREISPAIRDIASAVKDGLDDKTVNGVRCSCGEIILNCSSRLAILSFNRATSCSSSFLSNIFRLSARSRNSWIFRPVVS